MFDLNDLIAEFDHHNKILHLTARSQIRCQTREQGYALARAVKNLLKTYLGDERGYMITDYSKIIIEPKHIDEYAGAIREIIDTYLHPGGIARYGFEITRVTARIGHDIYIGDSPNIFNTRKEAFQFILNMIEGNVRDKKWEAGVVSPKP